MKHLAAIFAVLLVMGCGKDNPQPQGADLGGRLRSFNSGDFRIQQLPKCKATLSTNADLSFVSLETNNECYDAIYKIRVTFKCESNMVCNMVVPGEPKYTLILVNENTISVHYSRGTNNWEYLFTKNN